MVFTLCLWFDSFLYLNSSIDHQILIFSLNGLDLRFRGTILISWLILGAFSDKRSYLRLRNSTWLILIRSKLCWLIHFFIPYVLWWMHNFTKKTRSGNFILMMKWHLYLDFRKMSYYVCLNKMLANLSALDILITTHVY